VALDQSRALHSAELLHAERSIWHVVAKFLEQVLGFDRLGVAVREDDRLAVGLTVESATGCEVRNLLTCFELRFEPRSYESQRAKVKKLSDYL
jgi:hypothetical protein